jgi:hypothetical protein
LLDYELLPRVHITPSACPHGYLCALTCHAHTHTHIHTYTHTHKHTHSHTHTPHTSHTQHTLCTTALQVSIEVGMQNSALAVVLARSAFADPLTALPGAISATVHSVLGSTLAALWRLSDAAAASKKSAGRR